MTVTPWQGDACSLVDAFRTRERNPKEELEGVLAAIDASALDAASFLDTEGARAAAARADASLPFGGVPIGVKELEPVEGWPSAEASLVFADRFADQSTTMVRRLEGAGVVKVAQTTASEFGGLISIPAGTVDGLPVGMQVIGRHHADALLLDLARVVENERPWPLVAPGAPV